MPDDYNRRDFLGLGAAAAAAGLVGCEDSAPAGAAGDLATRGDASDARALDAGAIDAEASADAWPDAEGDAELDAGVDASADAELEAVDAEVDAELDAGRVAPPEEIPEVEGFPLGVASGDVTETNAILWTNYLGEAALLLVVWEWDGGRDIAVHDELMVEPERGFVHADVGGLRPGQRYRYAFLLLEGEAPVGRSQIGRFRAALAPDALEAFTFGAVSCARNGWPTFGPLAHAGSREDLDLFLFLGDTSYNDGASSLVEFRAKWAENLSTDAFRALRGSTSVLATWDDHEVDNNFDPEVTDPVTVANARVSFFENQPLRRDPMDPDRIWKRIRWGRTAEFFVLDCRGERLPSTRGTPEAQYLSPAQMDWLQQGLLDSDAVFKVVLNSVPLGDLPTAGINADRWAGYPAAREAFLLFLDAERIPGLFFISGDFHFPSMGRLTAEGPGSTIPEFLVGAAAHLPNPLWLLAQAQPHTDWAVGDNNYAAFRLDPEEGAVHVNHALDGSVLVERGYRP